MAIRYDLDDSRELRHRLLVVPTRGQRYGRKMELLGTSAPTGPAPDAPVTRGRSCAPGPAVGPQPRSAGRHQPPGSGPSRTDPPAHDALLAVRLEQGEQDRVVAAPAHHSAPGPPAARRPGRDQPVPGRDDRARPWPAV